MPNMWTVAVVLVAIGAVALASSHNFHDSPVDAEQQTHLIDLDEENWDRMLQDEWMVEFFAPWCPACRNLASTWTRFASAALDYDVKVAKIDVTTSPSLSGRFFVTALPTIYHVKDGVLRQYRGSRDFNTLVQFLKMEEWSKIEPLPAWKKPDAPHMSALSYFFKLSHTLKDFNTRLQEDYGLPTWGAYALFAFATIFVGAALGMLLVCVVDFLYPPKKRYNCLENNQRAQDGIEDLAKDEIEDDAVIDDKDSDTENEQQDKDESEEETVDEQKPDEEENGAISTDADVTTTDDEATKKTKIADAAIVPEPEKVAGSPGAETRKRKTRKAD